MEISNPNGLSHGDEEKALQALLDAFGSNFSLEEIASAYCKAGQNADMAGKILYKMQGNTSSSTPASNVGMRNEKSSKSSNGDIPESSFPNEKSSIPKKKWRPVSGGTISSVLKDYSRSNSIHCANGSQMVTKPLKLDQEELPMSEIWMENDNLKPAKGNNLHKDMEDFLLNMLGYGFKLDRNVIRQVLGDCGYDMQKSIEKLLNQSSKRLEKRNEPDDKSSQKASDMRRNSEGSSTQERLQLQHVDYSVCSESRVSNTNGGKISKEQKERNNLQKEVLASLFTAADKSEELPRRSVKTVRRPIGLGELVTPRDLIPDKVVAFHSHSEAKDYEDDEEEEGSYHALRKAVKEYRATMNAYYKAAVGAFVKGDHVRTHKLLEQGHFFFEKARKADEEANEKIFETSSNVDAQDFMMLDLHEVGAKDAIRLLKCHLSSLAGIPCIKYLKVVLEGNDEDISKGARRRLVMKLLERESITWSEDENIGTISIRLDIVDPKSLSFAKK